MFKLFYFFVSLLLISCVVKSHTPVLYRGDSNKLIPYVELVGMEKYITSCDRFTKACSVVVYVDPWLHNPVGAGIRGNLICIYKINDLEVSSLKSKSIFLGAKKSIKVSFRSMISVLGNKRSYLTVGCYFKYKVK